MAKTNEELKQKFDEKTLKRAEICNSKCKLCTMGRKKQTGMMNKLVRLEAKSKLCPWCRAYEKVYGVPAYEKHS